MAYYKAALKTFRETYPDASSCKANKAESHLNGLPDELLLGIVDYIDNTHKPSLKFLCLVDKKWCAITTPFIFQTIRLKLVSEYSTQYDVIYLNMMLVRRQCLDHVRTLEIDGFVAEREHWLEWESCEHCSKPRVPGRPRDALHHHWTGWKKWTALPRQWVELPSPVSQIGENTRWEQKINIEEEAFKSLTSLLGVASRVDTIIWNCHNDVPDCLIDHIRQYNPNLRLRINTQRLTTINTEVFNNGVRAKDLARLESPLLDAVRIHHVIDDLSRFDFDRYAVEAILKVAICSAPNLKSVELVRSITKKIPEKDVEIVEFHELMQRANGLNIAKLDSLSLHMRRVIDKEYIKMWPNIVDCAQLQSLSFESPLLSDGIGWLAWRNPFLSLKHLTIDFGLHLADVRNADHLQQWLTCLPGLRSLSIKCLFCKEFLATIRAAAHHHGDTLRKLVVERPMLSKTSVSAHSVDLGMADLKDIARSCLVLEELEIPLRRWASGKGEIELYRTLGMFPNLQVVSLMLDCSGWDRYSDGNTNRHWVFRMQREDAIAVSSPGNNATVSSANVQYAMINAALDKELASEIWRFISAHKVGLPLRSLRLRTHGSNFFDAGGLQPGDDPKFPDLLAVFNELQREYLVTKAVRDDEELLIQEIGEKERLARKKGVSRPQGPEMHLFRELWPAKAAKSHWRTDWFGFPLQKEATEMTVAGAQA